MNVWGSAGVADSGVKGAEALGGLPEGAGHHTDRRNRRVVRNQCAAAAGAAGVLSLPVIQIHASDSLSVPCALK
jgi:hypothetical protein